MSGGKNGGRVMKKMTLVQAVNDAMAIALATDEKVLILGEDVGKNGGVFRATDHLQDKFGTHRVVDTPLSEAGIIGSAIGLSVAGLKPIAEIQFLGFIYPAYEQIMTHVSRLRTRTQGRYVAPIVIRAPYGGGVRAHEIHSDSVETLFTHMPGMQVVIPSTPYDAKGLLLAAIASEDPVLFLEPMRSYRSLREEVPTEAYEVPIGKGVIRQEGEDVTLIAWGAMVPIISEAATQLKEEGIRAEVIDLRTLAPLDEALIVQSVQKTTRAVVVHEAQRTSGFGGELAAIIQEKAFYSLRSPVLRVTGYDVPYPFFSIEQLYLPNVQRVVQAVKQVMDEGGIQG